MSDETTKVELTDAERKYLARVVEQHIDVMSQLTYSERGPEFHETLLAKLQPQRKETP